MSKFEIKYLIDKTKNEKHKLVIEMLYSSGLRLQELIDLKREDIEPNRNVVNVHQGKGKKGSFNIIQF